MKLLQFTRANNLGRLHGELIAAVPALAPVQGADGRQEAVFTLSGNGSQIALSVPDTLSAAAETAIGTVIAAHDPTPTPAPTPADYGSDIPTDFEATVAATVANLRAYIGLATPTNAQSTAAIKLLCRIALWQIRRIFA